MADNPITGVLSLLRLFRRGPISVGSSVIDHVRQWAGEGASEAQVTRLLAYAQDVTIAAEDLIRASNWGEEAKAGLLQVTAQMMAAFMPQNVGNAVSSYFSALDSSITMFAILASASGMKEVGGAPPAALQELVTDVVDLIAAIDAAGLDPVVHRTATRHLRILETLLRNVDAFGVDAAVVAYFDMLTRLRRTASAASPSTKEWLSTVWPELERWAGRLAIIDEALNHGQDLLEHVQKVAGLLPHIPGLG